MDTTRPCGRYTYKSGGAVVEGEPVIIHTRAVHYYNMSVIHLVKRRASQHEHGLARLLSEIARLIQQQMHDTLLTSQTRVSCMFNYIFQPLALVGFTEEKFPRQSDNCCSATV